MTLTDKQSEALDAIMGANNILLYGGARSGKTFITIYFIYYVCLTFPTVRVLIARRYATDIRSSIWNDTILKVGKLLELQFGKELKTNEQSMTVTFPNGSEIICNGLDDKERVDKCLGQEYAIIYINESQDVPWSTVKVLKTRLAQKIQGFKNRFMCDLNPTSIEHWTYKVWFDLVNPDSGDPLLGSYAKVQMNPYDNAANLAEGFIEDNLAGLTGQERERFLLGEYSTNSDLQVFKPVSLHDDLDEEFARWAHGRWKDVRVTAGLDLGFEDADAFVIAAYIDGEPDVWLINEYKERKNDITGLARDTRGCIIKCKERHPIRSDAWDELDIWTDTGGLGRKTAAELAEVFELPVRAAYKRDKEVGLFFVQSDVNAGRLHMQREGIFHDECRRVTWKRNRESGKVEQVLDNDAYHPDLLDAVIYLYRFLMKHGNTAMVGRTVEAVKGIEDKSYFDVQAEVERVLGNAEAVW